ncbi:hypothetical protein KJ865_02860, partial [Myxococcota bacterium]|nr:hypothetical protein [Myxococcota bacterium]
LEKRVLFDCIEEEGLLDSAYNLHAVLQLMMELTRFFDKAITHSVLGYEHQRRIGDGGRPAIHPTGVWFPVSSPRSDDDHH